MLNNAKKNVLSGIGGTSLGRKLLLQGVDTETQAFISDIKAAVALYYDRDTARQVKTKLIKLASKFVNATNEKKLELEKVQRLSFDLSDSLTSLMANYKAVHIICSQPLSKTETPKNSEKAKSLDSPELTEKIDGFVKEAETLRDIAVDIFADFVSEKNQKMLKGVAGVLLKREFLEAFLTQDSYEDLSQKLLQKLGEIMGDVSANIMLCSAANCQQTAAKMRKSGKTRNLPVFCTAHLAGWLAEVKGKSLDQRLEDVLMEKESSLFFKAFLEEEGLHWLWQLISVIRMNRGSQNKEFKMLAIQQVFTTFKERKMEGFEVVRKLEEEVDEDKYVGRTVEKALDEILKTLKEAFGKFLESAEYKKFEESFELGDSN